MSKRLQIVVEDGEAGRFEACAKADGLTFSAWARRVLRAAEQAASSEDPEAKLAAVRTAYEHSFPTADVSTMLGEIERGYLAPEQA